MKKCELIVWDNIYSSKNDQIQIPINIYEFVVSQNILTQSLKTFVCILCNFIHCLSPQITLIHVFCTHIPSSCTLSNYSWCAKFNRNIHIVKLTVSFPRFVDEFWQLKCSRWRICVYYMSCWNADRFCEKTRSQKLWSIPYTKNFSRI